MPITNVEPDGTTTISFTTALYPTKDGVTEISEAIDVDVTYAVS